MKISYKDLKRPLDFSVVVDAIIAQGNRLIRDGENFGWYIYQFQRLLDIELIQRHVELRPGIQNAPILDVVPFVHAKVLLCGGSTLAPALSLDLSFWLDDNFNRGCLDLQEYIFLKRTGGSRVDFFNAQIRVDELLRQATSIVEHPRKEGWNGKLSKAVPGFSESVYKEALHDACHDKYK